jgi:hypothetical protein
MKKHLLLGVFVHYYSIEWLVPITVVQNGLIKLCFPKSEGQVLWEDQARVRHT